MRPLLPARVITVKLIELQKSLLDTRKFFRPFLNTLTANDSIPLMRPLLPARVITVKLIELQKSLLDTRKFFRPFLNTLTANDSIPKN